MFGWIRSKAFRNLRAKRYSRHSRRLACERLTERQLFATDVLADLDFDDGTEGIAVYSNTAASGVVTTESGNAVFEDTFTRDETQTLLFKELGSVDSVEVSFRFRLPDGIPVAEIPREYGSVKLSRLNPPDGIPRYHSMQNDLHVMLENGTISYEISFYVEQADFADRVRIDDPREWTSIRYQAFRNTPGQGDGIWKVWVNEELVVDRADVRFVDNADYFFTSTWVGGNISFGGADPATSFRRQLDDVRYSVNLEQSAPAEPLPSQPGASVVFAEGHTILVVDGGIERDELALTADESGQVQLVLNGTQSQFQGIDSIEIYGNSGDDIIHARTAMPITINGGAGNDLIYSFATEAFVNAGIGDDTVIAYGGSQIIAGGLGADTLISFATTARHVVATGELAGSEGVSDDAVDTVFALGYFEPVMLADSRDVIRRWSWRR